jgi:hypothetical protein
MPTGFTWGHTGTPAGPSYLQGFQKGKGGRLTDLLGQEFLPELDRARKSRSSIETIFSDFLDPTKGEAAVTGGAERIAGDLLRPGGAIPEAIRRARGQSIASGFGTQGGDLSRQESNIVSEGLRSGVGSYLGQALPAMYEGAAGRAAGAYGLTQENALRMLESLYTGLGSAESLNMANQKQGLLGLGFLGL